jgi:hypothetical protein
LRKWLREVGVDGDENGVGNRMLGADGLIMHMQQDEQYQPTFFRHIDIEFFYLLDFDAGVFNGYELKGWDPWADEGEDDYDQYKPWYSQLPKHDHVAVVKSIAPRKRRKKAAE